MSPAAARLLPLLLLAPTLAGCFRTGAEPGATLPAFALTTLDGANVTRESLAGRVVVLDAMATYCGPCRASMPEFAKLLAAREGKPLTFLTLDVDDTDRSQNLLPEFRARYNATWAFAYSGAELRHALGVRGIPTLYVADKDGKIRERIEYTTKGLTAAEVGAKIDPLIAQAEAAHG